MFDVGQLVLLSKGKLNLGLPRKKKDRYIGLFTIVKDMGPAAYKLDLSHSPKLR